jgi:hypothetical protein
LSLVGRLNSAVDELPSPMGKTNAPAYYSDYLKQANVSGQLDYILVCNAERLKDPLPATMSIVAKAGRFTVLRVGAAKTHLADTQSQP